MNYSTFAPVLRVVRFLTECDHEAGSRRSMSRNKFLSLLLCQLIWIFPIAFFLISFSSETVILSDSKSPSFYGPFKVFDDHELEQLKKIDENWSEFEISMKENFNQKGLMQPWDKSCFIWIPECYYIAKHQTIIQTVEEAIGPNVLLYGMKVWRGRNDNMEKFHKDMESLGCAKSMTFISGRTVQLISQSHKITERMSQMVLRVLHHLEKESSRITGQKEQLIFLKKFFITRLMQIVRDANLQFENIRSHEGHGVLFHGGTIYRIGNGDGDDDEGLLMQFVSSDCRVRVSRNHVWGLHGVSHSLSMLPVLLVSGNITNNVSSLNDIRLSLAKDETLRLTIDIEHEDASKLSGTKLGPSTNYDFLNEESPKIEVFVDSSTSKEWHSTVWKFWQVADIRTSLIERGRIERFLLAERNLPVEFDRVSGDGQQVLVVLHHGMQYFRASNDGKLRHWELLELRPGSAVLLLEDLIHAFMPLGEETSFLSLRWIGYGNRNSSITEFDHGHMKLGNVIIPLRCYSTYPTGGQTITLVSGQAYDPENAENCDVVVFMVEGQLLQILPFNETIQSPSTLLIPADKYLVLWNIGRQLVKFFVMHVCHCDNSMQIAMSVGATGKIF